jgi:glucosamine--fructose-6-phosphate aminotransferase (isomerizing)
MTTPGAATHAEILSQPEAWAATLDALRAHAVHLRSFYQAGHYDSVLFTGCGSPHYLALSAAAAFQALAGVPARALPASEIWLQPEAAFRAKSNGLLVALSRSGETTELLRACETFRERSGGDVLTLCCYPDRPLTGLGAANLVLPAGQETSLVQTRAFTVLYLATLALAGLWAGRDGWLDDLARLPEACRRLLAVAQAPARELGHDPRLDRFYFLGGGARYGLACELSLKMQEASLSPAQPYHFLEFRHGPKAMLTPSTLVVGLLSESSHRHEAALRDDIRARGALAFLAGEGQADLAFDSRLDEIARGPLYLPFGQLLAYERALHAGLDPDRPENLQAVVTLTEP